MGGDGTVRSREDRGNGMGGEDKEQGGQQKEVGGDHEAEVGS